MNTFTASSGWMVSFTERDGRVEIDIESRSSGEVFVFQASKLEALREFFQAERDEALGRWRDPERPHMVVYPSDQARDGSSNTWFHFLDEKSSITDSGTRSIPCDRGRDWEATRVAYFAAHPEPKPWHDAKPGEVWVITWAAGDESPYIVPRGGWDRNMAVESARRIYPEA